MAGFFKGLFGKRGKRQASDETSQKSIYRTSAKKSGKQKGSRLVKGKNLTPPAGLKRSPTGSLRPPDSGSLAAAREGSMRRTDSALEQRASGDAAGAAVSQAGAAAPPRKQETGPFEPSDPSPLQRVGTSPYPLESNRRQHRRAPLGEWARCALAGSERSEQVLDVSEGGLRLRQSSMFQLYAKMEISLPLPGPEGPVLCPVLGVIMWRNQHGMGVKFKELTEETLVQLRRFIEAHFEE